MAGVADSLDVTDDRLEGVLRVGVQAGLRHVDRAELARLDRIRADVPAAATSPPSGSIRRRRITDVSREALGSLSRAFVDPERRRIYAGLNYPGTVRLPRGHRPGRWARRAPAGHQAAAHLYRDVAGLRPGGAHAVLHRRQHRLSRPHRARYDHAAAAHAAQGRAHRRPVVQPSRPIAVGHPDVQRHLHAGADPGAIHQLERASTRGRTAKRSTTSTSRPTASWCRYRSARSTAARACAS